MLPRAVIADQFDQLAPALDVDREHRAAPEAGGGIARSAPSVEGVAAPGLGSVEHLTQE
jgi:hypothetical protein